MESPPKALRSGRYTIVRALGEGSQGETFEAIDNGVPARGVEEDLHGRWHRYVELARSGEARGARSAEHAEERGGGRGAKPPDREDRAARRAALEPKERLVAIKSFRVGKAKAWKDVELAEREARTLASLDHPRLPRYIEHFEEDGALYLVMEKVEGESLAAILGRGGSLDAGEVTRMLEDLADALRYLHGRSPFIVHRDIKPGNVIRRPDGSYALVDFGAVRDRLKPGGGSTVVGTFGYMAPEQFQGRASPKSDVYGLGATAITMLTGAEPEDLPHEGLGIDVARAVPRSAPKGLVRALTAMLVPDPDRRADSVDDALAFLRASPGKQARAKESRGKKREAETPAQRRREEWKERRRTRREERDRRRALRRARRLPFLPQLVARVGLLVAMLAVWLAVAVFVPALLVALSLVFGAPMRRAAGACVRASSRAQARLNDAWAWIAQRGERGADADPRYRVLSELDDVRAVTPSQAQALAIKEASDARAAARTKREELEAEEERRAELEALETEEEQNARAAPRRRLR